MDLRLLILVIATYATKNVFSPTLGQITTPCTPSMITIFTPCINFVTNSTTNGTSPTSDCCSSLKSLMGNGKDCLCLIASGSVPFRIPINRTLAISLPRACNMPGVPLQCKVDGAPVPSPAPEPVANMPSHSSSEAPSPSVSGLTPLKPMSPTTAPGDGKSPAPPTPTTTGGAPTSNPGSRVGVTPSTAHPLYRISHSHLMILLATIALKYY